MKEFIADLMEKRIEGQGMNALKIKTGGKRFRVTGITLCLFVLFLFAGSRASGQTNTPADSLKIKEQSGKPDNNGNGRNRYGSGNNNSGNNGSGQAVKRVRAGKPDMSRARGARPPMIVRPSGSGVPKGIGKPGGVGRHGGR
jgi:hypothetical protein